MKISTAPALAPLIFIAACGSGDRQAGGNSSDQKQAVADVLPKAGQWEMTTETVSIDMPGMTEAQKKDYLADEKGKPQKHCLTPEEAKSPNWVLGGEKNKSLSCTLTMKDGKIPESTCTEGESQMKVAGTYGEDSVRLDMTATSPAPRGLAGTVTMVMRISGKRIADSCTSNG